MPKKKIEPAIDQTPAPEPSVLTGVETIDIFDNAKRFIRQYSRVVHGDNFAELADSYIAGHPNCHKV